MVLDLAVVGTTVYLLVRRTPKGLWEPNNDYLNDADGSFRWIAIFLTRKVRDAFDFGYSRRFQNCSFLGEIAVFKATALPVERRFWLLRIVRGNATSGSPQIDPM